MSNYEVIIAGVPACCSHLFVNTILILFLQLPAITFPSNSHHDTVNTLCVCARVSVYVHLECSSPVTVIVVVWVLLITGVNG